MTDDLTFMPETPLRYGGEDWPAGKPFGVAARDRWLAEEWVSRGWGRVVGGPEEAVERPEPCPFPDCKRRFDSVEEAGEHARAAHPRWYRDSVAPPEDSPAPRAEGVEGLIEAPSVERLIETKKAGLTAGPLRAPAPELDEPPAAEPPPEPIIGLEAVPGRPREAAGAAEGEPAAEPPVEAPQAEGEAEKRPPRTRGR